MATLSSHLSGAYFELMKTGSISIRPLLLFIMVLVFNSNMCLSAQFIYHVDTCEYSCNEYDRLTNYANTVSAILEVNVDSVTMVDNGKEENFWIHFRVYDVVYGNFSNGSFRVFYSPSTFVEAIIKGIEAVYDPPWCGNSYDEIRSFRMMKPKLGYAGLIGVTQDGIVTKLVLSEVTPRYDFRDQPKLVDGEVNYEAIKVVTSSQNVRPGKQEQTIFSSRRELLEFLEKLE